ncbi:hypothetical protein GCM10025868_21990 [Angustibacter aerolatus]|uniref:Uncharacterized protein n=1 Tax=Angustibacter aerolatus TaxID=1162965 RepID=A0ABQ6JHV4_9ACTN|nr:hypothetical protein GCM10025868_21990 [Angustibacter aerolatus]
MRTDASSARRLEVAGRDLTQPVTHLHVEPERGGERSRGLLRAHQRGRVDRLDGLVGQAGGHPLRLLTAEVGEVGSGHRGVEQPLDVGRGLPVPDEDQAHRPIVPADRPRGPPGPAPRAQRGVVARFTRARVCPLSRAWVPLIAR